MMLSPNPFTLFFALLLCLPLAIVFTTTTTTTPTTTTTLAGNVPSPITLKPNYVSRRTKPDPDDQNPRSESSDDVIPQPPTPPPLPELPPDDAEDLSLFRRASRVNPTPTPPKKIAFMFLTTTPLPFAPLWERFFKPPKRSKKSHPYNIYIHADPTHDYTPPFSGVFSNKVIPYSKATRRHSPTLVAAARRLLSHALLHDPSNHMFVLLSSSCIPLHSLDFTYKTLARSKKSFIEILSNETGAYERWAARGEYAMLPEVPFEDFRIGSQFWALTRRHARMAARDVTLWRKFRLPCVDVDVCYPDEHYFSTLLSTVGPKGVVPATLTHVDWRGGSDGHPRSYNSSVVGPALIRRLRSKTPRYGDFGDGGFNGSDLATKEAGRSDPFLFARKFEPECLGPLLNISDGFIFRD